MEIAGSAIRDSQGRTLLLRGCNIGAGSKVPQEPPGASHISGSLDSPAKVSFIGRPFPLEEAAEHFERLKHWGLWFHRFVITWEAVEHEGPGVYDEAYLAYLRKLFLLAGEYGLSFCIDPHQDVWSRWTGGDGAPAWTLEKIGMDLNRLDQCGAALTHQRYREQHPDAPFPRMIWPTNYNRYAAATMFTLFFGGNVFAPECRIEGQSAQDWLQERYLACMRHVYRRLKNCAAIAGWGAMNEPNPGFIGYRNLEHLENAPVTLGPIPFPLDAMAAASGHPREVPVYALGFRGRRVAGRELINPQGLSLFKEGFVCPWKSAGVWTDAGGTVKLLRKDHFAEYQGRPVCFAEDFLAPFISRFAGRVREVNAKSFIFVEGVPYEAPPRWRDGNPPGIIHAFHWYDGLPLMLRFFRPWLAVDYAPGELTVKGAQAQGDGPSETLKLVLGRKKAAALYGRTLARLKSRTHEALGPVPCMIGEFGLPFDLQRGKAFKTGNYALHEEALGMYYDALDENLLHSAIWNYNASNSGAAGDGWNGEDLSIFSQGRGRAGGGWLRPYPLATAGSPLSLSWDRKKGRFRYAFLADPSVAAPTEIFAPPECFGGAPAVSILPEDTPGLSARYSAGERRILIRNNGYAGEAELLARRT